MVATIPAGSTYVTTKQLGSLGLFNAVNGVSTSPLNSKVYTDPKYEVKDSGGNVTGYNLPNDVYAQAIKGNAQNNQQGFSPARGADIVAYGTAAPGVAPVTAAPITNATPVAAAPSTAAPASASTVVDSGGPSAPNASSANVVTPAGAPPINLADIMQSGVAPSQQNPTGANGAPLAWQNGVLAADPTWDGVDRSQQQSPAKQNNASTINIGGRIIQNPIFPDGASVGGGVIS